MLRLKLAIAALCALLPAAVHAQAATRIIDCASGLGVLDFDGVATTDWNTLVSEDFHDAGSVDAGKLPAGLVFVRVVVLVTSSGAGHAVRWKLRARAGAGDATAHRLLVPAASSATQEFRGRSVTAISYAKGDAAVTGQIVACFDRP